MTSEIFSDWLKLQRQKRKIAMVIDNCPAHPQVRGLKCIELIFLPPNTTSKTQPMDQGVIQNFKTHYRKRVILRQMKAIDEKKEFTISILDAMRLMQQAWEMVQLRTIANCFRHANFLCPDSSNDVTETNSGTDNDPEDDIPLARLAKLGLSTAMIQDYMTVDDNLPTSERLTDNDIINESSAADLPSPKMPTIMPTTMRILMPTDEIPSCQHPSVKLWTLVRNFRIILSNVNIQMTFWSV